MKTRKMPLYPFRLKSSRHSKLKKMAIDRETMRLLRRMYPAGGFFDIEFHYRGSWTEKKAGAK